jgi:seryl-tRNA synthetase
MSKKNRKKNRIETFRAPSEPKPVQIEKQAEKEDDLRKDFNNLALSIGFIILVMIAIYYFNQTDNILKYVTEKIFSAF